MGVRHLIIVLSLAAIVPWLLRPNPAAEPHLPKPTPELSSKPTQVDPQPGPLGEVSFRLTPAGDSVLMTLVNNTNSSLSYYDSFLADLHPVDYPGHDFGVPPNVWVEFLDEEGERVRETYAQSIYNSDSWSPMFSRPDSIRVIERPMRGYQVPAKGRIWCKVPLRSCLQMVPSRVLAKAKRVRVRAVVYFDSEMEVSKEAVSAWMPMPRGLEGPTPQNQATP